MDSVIEVRDEISTDGIYYTVAVWPDVKTAMEQTDLCVKTHGEPPMSDNMMEDDDLRHIQLDYYEIKFGWPYEKTWLGFRTWTRDDDGNGEWGPWVEAIPKGKVQKSITPKANNPAIALI